MRVFRRQRLRVTKLVLCMAVIIAGVWFYRSKMNTKSFTKSSVDALKLDQTNSSAPEWVQGSGNFEPPEEPPRNGPGEGGKAHHLSPERMNDANESIAQYGINVACSDEISQDRTVPDLRHEECKHWNYPENLPKVSVIVVFHNEAFSVLMRTVHSIINRSPQQFLEEVIIVDDYSDKEDLKDKLESYIQRWGGKVRLIRNKEREGLINTRSRGAREAHGEIIVFVDAHSEVNKNWLPPLITPIFNNRTTITVPLVDTIDYDNFEIRTVYSHTNHWRGTFEWGLEFRQNIVPAREVRGRRHHTEPYRSPTHAGGYFAINRQYFLEIGLYDPGLLVWGGENLDLSFKVWQCGGSLLYVPCSRVGHVAKLHYTYGYGDLSKKRKGDLILGNYKRVVETWMDEKYKEYFYRRQPSAKYVEMGDISEQLKLKERLQCKSFQWYLDNVAYDVRIMIPPPPPNRKWGHMKNLGSHSCLGQFSQVPHLMVTAPCNDGSIVRLNVQGQLGIGQYCVLYKTNEVKVDHCTLRTVDGPWEYSNTTQLMYHKVVGKCMAAESEQPKHLSLLPCDPSDTYQQWLFIDIKA